VIPTTRDVRLTADSDHQRAQQAQPSPRDQEYPGRPRYPDPSVQSGQLVPLVKHQGNGQEKDGQDEDEEEEEEEETVQSRNA
jgi:hypothetical protein